MKIFDFNAEAFIENDHGHQGNTSFRHCGVTFVGDECPVCRTSGLYAKFVALTGADTPAPEPKEKKPAAKPAAPAAKADAKKEPAPDKSPKVQTPPAAAAKADEPKDAK